MYKRQALKLLLIDTTADSILMSSTSETVVLPVIARGASFSVYDAGAVSIADRTGASLAATNSISLLNILLFRSPSLISKLTVRVSVEGLALVLL